jgi:hypothetical protein
MPDDPQFEKSDFENVISNLLNSKPLPKKQVKTSKKTKAKTVIPARSGRPPKPAK